MLGKQLNVLLLLKKLPTYGTKQNKKSWLMKFIEIKDKKNQNPNQVLISSLHGKNWTSNKDYRLLHVLANPKCLLAICILLNGALFRIEQDVGLAKQNLSKFLAIDIVKDSINLNAFFLRPGRTLQD
jgi:hypothetical protein